jgi:hypothetical protein
MVHEELLAIEESSSGHNGWEVDIVSGRKCISVHHAFAWAGAICSGPCAFSRRPEAPGMDIKIELRRTVTWRSGIFYVEAPHADGFKFWSAGAGSSLVGSGEAASAGIHAIL